MTLRSALLFLGVVAAGCGPSVLLERPAGWPGDWKGRKLFHTPVAYIYASSSGAAGQADRLALAVEKDFRERTGAAPRKGLLIVTDEEDQPIVPDPRTLFRLWAQVSSNRATPLGEEELERKWRKETKELEGAGLELIDMLQATAVPVTSDDASSLLGLSEEVAHEIPWAVALPSRAVVQRYSKKMLRNALEKEGVGTFMRVALSPILSFAEGKMTDALSMAIDLILFARWMKDLTDRPDEEKSAIVNAYLEDRKKDVLGSLEKLMKDPPRKD